MSSFDFTTVSALSAKTLLVCPSHPRILHLNEKPETSCTHSGDYSSFEERNLFLVVSAQGKFSCPSAFIGLLIPSSPAKKTPQKVESQAPSSDKVLATLRAAHIPLFSSADSKNIPWFETLFPSHPVPAISSDNVIEKSVFNPLFTELASKCKKIIKKDLDYSFSHLPHDISTMLIEVIIHSTRKSTASSAPKRVLNKAKEIKTDTPAPKKTSPTKAPKAKIDSPAPKAITASKQKKAKTTSVSKPATPTKQKTSAKSSQSQSPAPLATMSSVISALHESEAPRFYFKDKETPTFSQLFPGTSMPPKSYVSGNVKIAPEHFNPLLSIRVKSAHKFLRAKNLRVTKLPAKFMKYQTRLICRSVEQATKTKKDSIKAKKAAKKSKKSGSKIEFVPSTLPFSPPAPQASSDSQDKEIDDIRSLRDLRELVSAYIADLDSTIPSDPRIPSLITKHAFWQTSTPGFSFEKASLKGNLLQFHGFTTVMESFKPHGSDVPQLRSVKQSSVIEHDLTKILPILHRRCSLSYNSIVRS
jgi:hypothetical protein